MKAKLSSAELPLILKEAVYPQKLHGCELGEGVGGGVVHNLAIYLVYQNCCLSSIAVANKKYCWYFTGYHVLIFTLAFKT